MNDTLSNVLLYRVDLNKPIKKKFLDTLLAEGDHKAHRIDIELVRNGAPVSIPSGTGVYGYFTNHTSKPNEEEFTLVMKGSADGNVASLTLDRACYVKTCQFSLIIKVTVGDEITTVFWGDGTVMRSRSDTIADPTNVVSDLDTLLAKIAAMEAATAEGTAAAADARATAAGMRGQVGLVVEKVYEKPYDRNVVLEIGGINPETGANAANSDTALCRAKYISAAKEDLLMAFDLPGYEWTCWSYKSQSVSNVSHKNTDGWQSADTPVQIKFVDGDAYFRVAFRRTDGADLTQEYSNILAALKFYTHERPLEVDDTLTQNGAAADAKATGERIDMISGQTVNLVDMAALESGSSVTVTHNADGTVTLKTKKAAAYATMSLFPYVGAAANKPQTSYCLRMKIESCTSTDADGNALTPAVSLRYRGTDNGSNQMSYGIPTCTAPGDYVGIVYTSGWEGWIGLTITGGTSANAEVTISELMIAESDYPIPYVPYGIKALDHQARAYAHGAHMAAQSWGKSNVLASANQFAQLRYTPIRTLPSQFGDFPAGEERRGVPYSSARAVDKMIGLHVTVHTFMTAIRNPRSVLYTRQLTTNNAKTYYGCVCSALMTHCYGFRQNYIAAEYGKLDEFREIPWTAIDTGDALLTDSHIRMVTGVIRDRYGRITNVTTTEAGTPCVYVTANTHWDSFLKNHKDYRAFRYEDIDLAQYTPLDYVKGYPDEVLPEITYPDIMSEYGDKAALIEGETVTVNVINPDGYNKITVKIDGALEKTITTMEDFVLESCKPGLYEIEMSGSAKSSRTTFFVAQATCSYDSSTHMLTFSSSNAVPEAIYVFTATPTNKVVPFTDTDVQAGQIDLSAYADSAYKYAKVGFRCGEYGVATWYSYDLHQWEAFNG